MLRILSELEVPDSGEVVRRRGVRVEYLPQQPEFDPEHTAAEAVQGADLVVLAEGEIWPTLLLESGKRDIPVVMINARMTHRAHGRWRVARRAARQMMAQIRHVQAQDQVTANRLVSLGLPETRIEVTGTLKEGSAEIGRASCRERV